MYVYKHGERIYCHPQTDCFVESPRFSVARHVGHLKLGSKADQLYVRFSIIPKSGKMVLLKIFLSLTEWPLYMNIYIYTRIINKFPDFFFIWALLWIVHNETLVPFEVISFGCNALIVPFQQLLEGPMEVLLCEHVNDLRHSRFHLLNCVITTASELSE